jgi:hypothetical protein
MKHRATGLIVGKHGSQHYVEIQHPDGDSLASYIVGDMRSRRSLARFFADARGYVLRGTRPRPRRRRVTR